MGKINISGILYDSVVDGPGLRCTVFFQGCPHKCKGCHNEESWGFETNELYEVDTLVNTIITKTLTPKVTISGGEPFSQKEELLNLVKQLKMHDFHICIYTGYLYEELKDNVISDEVLKYTDILVDGKFEIDLKDLTNSFYGSTNQRILHLEGGEITNIE